MNINTTHALNQFFKFDEFGEVIGAVTKEDLDLLVRHVAKECSNVCLHHNKPQTLNFNPYERASDAIKGWFGVH